MLYFITTNFNEILWRIGQEVPKNLHVKEVHADGPELNLVRLITNDFRPNRRWYSFEACDIYDKLLKI